MIATVPREGTPAYSVWLAGNTLWHHEEAMRQFRAELRQLPSGELSAAEPLREHEGSLAGVNHLMVYVSRLANIEICQLEEIIQGTVYPALVSSRLLALKARRDGDGALTEILRAHAALAQLFPDILGSGRGGTEDDYVQARCVLIPRLISAVEVWSRSNDRSNSGELSKLVVEWNAVTGFG